MARQSISMLTAVLSCVAVVACEPAAVESSEIDPPTPGEATEATRQANSAMADRLPLDEASDFEDASRGFLAAIEGDAIRDADGNVV
ncbi:MAG: hypothetical protein AAGF33_16930, partial [Pseudomonadota bacterium]